MSAILAKEGEIAKSKGDGFRPVAALRITRIIVFPKGAKTGT